MPRIKELTTTFGRGQIDPSVLGLIDAPLYRNAVQTLTNWAITASGSIMRRPGSTFLANVGASARLIPFVFSESQEYIFAFYNGFVKIYGTDGTLHETLAGPWDATTIWELDYAQQADVMIVVHKSFKPRIISRDGATSFSIGEIQYDTQQIGDGTTADRVFEPFFQYSSFSQYLVPAGAGTGTPTGIDMEVQNPAGTAQAYFAGTAADWDGVRVRYQKKYQFELDTPTTTSAVTATVENPDGMERVPFPSPNPFQTEVGSKRLYVSWPYHGFKDGDSISIDGAQNTDLSAVNSLGAINQVHTVRVVERDTFYFIHGGTAGNATLSGVGGGTRVWLMFTDSGSQTPTPTNWWDESAYSNYRGWPSVVTFHENRLVLGGGASIPDTLFFSRVGQYFNFDTADGEASDAITVTLGAGQIQEIKHLVSNRDLQVFTTTGEFYFPQSVDGGPLTPSTVRASKQTSFGIADTEPTQLEGSTIFAQSNGKAVREFVFSAQGTLSYESVSLTAFSDSIIDNVRQMAVSTGNALGGEQYLYCVNNNTAGDMAVLHQLRQQQMAGWGKWTTDGKFISVLFMGDNVYFLTERVINSVTTYILEKQDTTGTIWLDGAIESTSGTTTHTGLSAYNGEEIYVTDTDTGDFVGTYTPSGGSITIASGHTNIAAGFSYTPSLTTLPVEPQLPEGFAVGTKKRIVRSVLRFLGTLNISVDGMELTVAKDVGSTPFTGEAEFYHRGISRDPTLTVTQTEPEPVELLSLMQEVKV